MRAGVQGLTEGFEHMLKLSKDAQVSQEGDKQMESNYVLQGDFSLSYQIKIYRGSSTK